jgi:hypothetical protein
MEPESSLPHSQEPAIESYSETVESSQHLHTCHIRLGIPTGLFPSDILITFLHFSSPPYVLHFILDSITLVTNDED